MQPGLLLPAVLTIALAGCTGITFKPQPGSAPLPPSGSQLIINQPIEIAADRTRVFFQRGKIFPGSGALDQYAPSCDLEVTELLPEPQLIKPGRFTITNITSGQEAVVRWDGLQLAGIGFGGGIWRRGGESIHRFIRFPLYSEAQPQVLRLTCRGAFEDYVMAKFPTTIEIQIALGEVISFGALMPVDNP